MNLLKYTRVPFLDNLSTITCHDANCFTKRIGQIPQELPPTDKNWSWENIYGACWSVSASKLKDFEKIIQVIMFLSAFNKF